MSIMKSKPFFAYRSFWPELETMKRMSEAGVKTICFYASNTLNSLGEPYCKYPPMWNWYGEYDFEPLDRQIADIQSVCPDVKFICMVDLNSPEWLIKNRICYDSFSELGRVICNPEWREFMNEYLHAFLEYSEKKHGDVIEAYAIASGQTCEWMDFSLGTESPAKTAAFQAWCRERGIPVPDDIPPPSIRNRVTHDAMLRDPQQDRLALQYWKFCSEAVADTLAYFVGEARTIVPAAKPIGAFYGYAVELNGDRFLSLSHLAYEKALDIPGLDFLISPGTYRDRAMGGGSGFMVPYGTVRQKGKSFMHECDQRTHTYNQYLTPYVTMPFPHWADDAADVAGLRREMSLALINGASLWWFDMWGGYYQTEVIFDNFRLMSEIWDEYAGKQEKSVAEIAMVIDPDGCYYLHPTDSDRNAWKNGMQEDSFLHGIRDKLNRVGAPYDIISFNDIAEMPDFERYKLVVFCTPFEIDQRKLEQLNKHVLRDNRHIVWLYAPGISDGSNWVPEQMQKLAGVEFGTPGVNRVDKESWQSVHVATPKDLTIDLLKELAAQSGVNIYCEEQTPVYANTRLLAVHSAEGGKIRIKLPRPVKTVLEVFSKTVITCDASGFEYDFPTPGTCLFDLEAK